MNELTKSCAAGVLIGAALFAVAKCANAGDLFYAANQANGAIVLTDTQGSCASGSSQYYTTDAGGRVTPTGCWSYSEPWVFGRDFKGVTHQWMASNFLETDYAKAKLGDK
jgi:hypothetical protein